MTGSLLTTVKEVRFRKELTLEKAERNGPLIMSLNIRLTTQCPPQQLTEPKIFNFKAGFIWIFYYNIKSIN